MTRCTRWQGDKVTQTNDVQPVTLSPGHLVTLSPCHPITVTGIASAAVVARHPVKVWVASIVLLAPLVWLGLQVKPTYRATGDLPPQTESLQGLAAIQRHFTAGEIGPITVLLSGTVDWTSREGQMEIDHLSRGFSTLP